MNFVDPAATLGEFCDYLLLAWSLTSHPWVSNDIRHGQPRGWLETQEHIDQALKLFRIVPLRFACFMHIPERLHIRGK